MIPFNKTYSLILAIIPWLMCISTKSSGQIEHYIDWKEIKVEQASCGFPSGSTQAASYYDVDPLGLQFDDVTVSFDHYPKEFIHCASGKIRNKNGAQEYIYTATLDGDHPEDCSYMTINFDRLVTNVNFDIIDIDQAVMHNWQDQITISPAWSAIDPNPNIEVNHKDGVLVGNAICDHQESDCNTNVTFSQPLHEITIEYCYGPSLEDNKPDRQIYNIGNISFETYDNKPELDAAIECPKEVNDIDLKDFWIAAGEKLELIIDDGQGYVAEVKTWHGPLYLNTSIQHYFDGCGDFHVLAMLSKSTQGATKRSASINQLLESPNTWLVQLPIEDSEAPVFNEELKAEYNIPCYNNFHLPEWRDVSDNCVASTQIEQEYYDEYLGNTTSCEYESFIRHWTITDACGNVSTASTQVNYLEPINQNTDRFVYSNIISANGDEINDQFTCLARADIYVKDFKVFDREGSLIYEETINATGRIETQFDYQYTSSLENGVYVYVVSITDGAGINDWISGEFTIIK